jgi:two-component system, response regulator, stage 0 sporulation protein F
MNSSIGTALAAALHWRSRAACGPACRVESRLRENHRGGAGPPAHRLRRRLARAAGAVSSSRGRVLVVEDEPHVGAMLRDILTELSYAVKHAVGGPEALKLVPVFEPDLVLLDLQMPGMSGVEVLDHLRREHPRLPVVILSGNQDVQLTRRALGNGAFDYIQKPFDIAVLARVVAAAIGSVSGG